ncbi:DUF2231 domain-containing protein [Paenibacillus sp. M1]|uniref:DUF2231 domain-containing protein n=1 Tax=Paenibacillus haidiansis TaxID=1574488 RepID=A0ABU7VM01_9BACL
MNYLWDNKHFIIIHFPIVLLLFGFLFDLAGLIWKKREWHTVALISFVAGTLSTIASVWSGPKMPNPAVGTHAQFGKITMYLAIVLCIVRIGILLWKKRDVGRNFIYLIVSFAAVVLVMYTAHLGGEMVHRPFDGGQFRQGQTGGQGEGGPSGMQGRPDGTGDGVMRQDGGQGAGDSPDGNATEGNATTEDDASAEGSDLTEGNAGL